MKLQLYIYETILNYACLPKDVELIKIINDSGKIDITLKSIFFFLIFHKISMKLK